MSSEFNKASKWITRMSDTLFLGYCHFIIWDSFQKLMGSDIVGQQEAEENVRAINQFHYFFVPTLEANKKVFAIELYKIFDTNKKTVSLRKIINFIRDNINSFKVNDFAEFNLDRELLDSLVPNYKPITKELLKECENKIDNIDELIEKLKDFRHSKVAHNFILEDTDTRMTVVEIEEIFLTASEIINKLSYALNHNSYQPFHAKNEVKNTTNLVIEYLKRFEPYRLKEIEERYSI